MNRNGDSATMYRTIPAVAGLNSVEGFDPFSLLGRTVSPATGEEGLQLGLAYKKLWFRLAYPKGRLQTNRVTLTEQTAVFEAQVYLDCSDANPVSSFVSSCARDDVPGGRYIQAAQYEAMDVALTDAGFGLQFADVCADTGSGKEGENALRSGTVDAIKGKNPAQGTATVGAASADGNMGHAGSVARSFPGAADGGTKKASAQGTQPFGARQPVQATTMSQGQAAPAGTGQPVRNAAIPQNSGRQPIGTRQPIQAAAMPQGWQPTGTRQPVQSATTPQGQAASVGARQPAQAAAPQGRMVPHIGMGQPNPAALPQRPGVQSATVAAAVSAPTGIIAPDSMQPGKDVKGGVDAGIQETAQKPAMAVQGKENPPVATRQAQPTEPKSLPDQLPVPPASAGHEGTVKAAAALTDSPMDSLPIPPAGKDGQLSAGTAAVMEDALPVSPGSPVKSSVQEAIELLKGQAILAGAGGGMAGDSGGTDIGGITGNAAISPTEGSGSSQTVGGETAQGKSAPRYTPDMPVEEIVSLMTLEEAGKVVVETGASKGQTIAEVAQRRPPSLKYYRYGGYNGPNNILRAAAQIMLDSIEEQKAG